MYCQLQVGKPDDFVIQTKKLSPELIAKQNPIFDLNKDGEILKSEIKKKLLEMVPKEYLDKFI